VLERTKEFQNSHFNSRVVGIHIRRTNHERAISNSPDEAFFEEAERALGDGFLLFLATDNATTVRLMQNRYGAKLLYRGKRLELAERWPRNDMDPRDIIDDLVDLWLLAACNHVIGCRDSSYSRIAMLLNGSPLCRAIHLSAI
jgi:hypothetical protein